jgi:hypothetical protein
MPNNNKLPKGEKNLEKNKFKYKYYRQRQKIYFYVSFF